MTIYEQMIESPMRWSPKDVIKIQIAEIERMIKALQAGKEVLMELSPVPNFWLHQKPQDAKSQEAEG